MDGRRRAEEVLAGEWQERALWSVWWWENSEEKVRANLARWKDAPQGFTGSECVSRHLLRTKKSSSYSGWATKQNDQQAVQLFHSSLRGLASILCIFAGWLLGDSKV